MNNELSTNNFNSKFKIFFCALIIFGLLLNGFFANAITDPEKLKEELEAQIKELQEKISQYNQKIAETKEKAKTLENEINILENQIKKIQLQIKEIDLDIKETELNISQIQEKIKKIEEKMDYQRMLLGEYLRLINQYDENSLLEIILSKDRFSDFFDEVNNLEVVQKNLQKTLNELSSSKKQLENKKDELESEKQEQYRLKAFQEIQKTTILKKQQRRKHILYITKGEEEAYQKKIKSKQKDIEFLKKQISLLERYHLTLQEAVRNAIFAGSKTGVRPAYLLAVLENESRLGLNVGTGNWRKDMYNCYRKLGKISRAEREKNAFFQICQELGLNPDLQPVSAEPYYGCGGAMGPAQFLPTTWLAYKQRISGLTGNNPPNPWNPKDAFTGAAIKLADAGANQRTYNSEWIAYAKYLAGSRWNRSKAAKYNADRVMELAREFEEKLFN